MRSERFAGAVETWDHEAAVAALSPGVVFRSPAVFKPYEGRDQVAALLGAVMKVFRDFRYTDRLEGADAEALIFEARVGDRQVEGMDLLRFDGDGLVRELVVMVRPLTGLTALAEAMGAQLAR